MTQNFVGNNHRTTTLNGLGTLAFRWLRHLDGMCMLDAMPRASVWLRPRGDASSDLGVALGGDASFVPLF